MSYKRETGNQTCLLERRHKSIEGQEGEALVASHGLS